MGSKPIGISASRGASILGLSDWNTPVETWIKIMDEIDPEFCSRNKYQKPERVESAPMRWGTAFENAIIQQAEEVFNIRAASSLEFIEWSISDQEKFFSYDKNNIITCHIDGQYFQHDQNAGILHEGKTTNIYTFADKWGEPETDRVPREYQIQVQHQMLCSGADRATISVLVFPKRPDEWEAEGLRVPGHEEEGHHTIDPEEWAAFLTEMGFFHQYPIKADPELQQAMIEAYQMFWKKHIIGLQPPEPQNYDDIKKLVTEPKGTIIADEKIERWSQEYKDINTELRSVYARKDDIKKRILAEMAERAEVPIDEDSVEKWILRNRQGKKLHSYNGKVFK